MTQPPEPVPDGTILFHAGFHKTGTTAVQSALASSRPAACSTMGPLPGHPAIPPSRRHGSHRPDLGVGLQGWQAPPAAYWDRIAPGRCPRHPGRVVISSEAFALASPELAREDRGDLGADRLHAVFTLRPFARLLSSSYQQYLKYGLAVPYDQLADRRVRCPARVPAIPELLATQRPRGESWGAGRTYSALDRVTSAGPRRCRPGGSCSAPSRASLELPAGLLVPDPKLSREQSFHDCC